MLTSQSKNQLAIQDETAYLLRSSPNAERLFCALREADKEGETMSLTELRQAVGVRRKTKPSHETNK